MINDIFFSMLQNNKKAALYKAAVKLIYVKDIMHPVRLRKIQHPYIPC